MELRPPPIQVHRVRRPMALVLGASLATSLVLGGCGSSGGGGGASAASGDWNAIIGEIRAAFGTSMISGSYKNDTLNIVLVNDFSPGGAQLFMCANILDILKKYGESGAHVVIKDQAGSELSTEKDC